MRRVLCFWQQTLINFVSFRHILFLPCHIPFTIWKFVPSSLRSPIWVALTFCWSFQCYPLYFSSLQSTTHDLFQPFGAHYQVWCWWIPTVLTPFPTVLMRQLINRATCLIVSISFRSFAFTPLIVLTIYKIKRTVIENDLFCYYCSSLFFSTSRFDAINEAI